MSARPPELLRTGHAEIDREHAVLLDLLKQLAEVCALPQPAASGCADCAPSRRGTCESALVVVMGKVLGFTADHFGFEEKAMHALPDDRERAAHFEAHIRDHERIVRELRQLALDIGSGLPLAAGIEMQAVVRRWLGEHILDFDVPLVALLDS